VRRQYFRNPITLIITLISLMSLGSVWASTPNSSPAWPNAIANTPPMGWNSYDSYNWNVTEAQVKANADYMATNLKQYGWQYIIIDWAWYYPGSGTGSPNQNASLQPTLRMDANGRLQPDLTRFPSATGTNGFKPLADYVHSKGLKFGIHMMRGIPRQAVAQNTPILGTTRTANQINNSTTAAWLNLMWGINMGSSGSQEYLNSLFQQYAAWGVDFVKIDDIAAPTYYTAEIQGYHNAIVNSGRNMVLSLSPGPTSTANGSHVSTNAHMWRIVNDLWDNWSSLDAEFAILNSWTPFRGPNSWPDPDMIPIGRLSLQGPVGSPRYSALTADEQRTLMTLWSITRSPLMWGGNLTDNRASELALMTNSRVIAVDQNSTNNRQITGGTYTVWAADIPGSSDKYVALFNRSSASATVSLNLNALGATSATATDLWSGSSVGSFTTTFSRSIPAHGAGLYRLVLSGSAATPVPPTYYTLTARHSGKLLDVFNASVADGGDVVQWAANSGANQQWQFVTVSGGYYNLVNRNSGKCLDVAGQSTADGANVDQWTCNGGQNQQWQMVTTTAPYFKLVSRHSGKCLDVYNNSTADGGNVDQWTCNGGANQDWRR
jgi:alpha-galactosidase